MENEIGNVYHELQALRKIYEILQTSIDEIKRDYTKLEERQDYVDKILVRGNGVPSLQETVRTLSKTVDDFISDIKVERIKREDAEKEKRRKNAEERSRWKWSILGIVIPAGMLFLYQFFVFWVKIAPVIENLK